MADMKSPELPSSEAVTLGTCRCCGQVRTVAPCVTREEADRKATRDCSCPEGDLVRRQMQEADTINQLLGDWDDEVRDYVRETARRLRAMDLAAVTMKLDEVTTIKMKIKGAAVIITRVNSNTTWWRSPKLAWIDWKARRPSAMLGLNRQQLKECLGAEVKDEVRDLYIRRGAAAGLSMMECKTLDQVAAIPEQLLKCGKDPHKILRYLEKENETWYTLQDYWSMQKRLGVDVQADPALEWPRRLRAAHDRAQSAVRYKADAKKEAEFAAMTARLQGLVWEHDGICIRPAASIRELVEEGTVLHHCVGGYGPAHCAGRCIFFIRHTRRPERSWFTLNVDVNAKKILQNHGYGNEWAHGKRLHIPRAVEEFVELWEKEVLRPWTLPPGKGAGQKAKAKKQRAKEAPAA